MYMFAQNMIHGERLAAMPCCTQHEYIRKGSIMCAFCHEDALLSEGTMELVAMELKQSGYFLARTLSYEVRPLLIPLQHHVSRALHYVAAVQQQVQATCGA